MMCVVQPEGVPQLCRTDEIGEICVCSIATGTSYYGLSGMTKNQFEVMALLHLGAMHARRRTQTHTDAHTHTDARRRTHTQTHTHTHRRTLTHTHTDAHTDTQTHT